PCSSAPPRSPRANHWPRGWPTAASRSQCSMRRTTLGRPRSSPLPARPAQSRSEEHTSELQSRFDLVCRLLLEKKKTDRGSDGNLNTFEIHSKKKILYFHQTLT